MNKAFEKILERLEEATYRIDDSATLSTRDVVNEEDAKEIVQEVAEEYNDGWIPCSERLPDDGIDEVIAQEKELSEHYKRRFDDLNEVEKLSNILLKDEIKYHEQLAEWLEELKMYKSLAPRELVSEKQKNDRTIEYSKGFDYGFKTGYNKAIDDLLGGMNQITCRQKCIRKALKDNIV